MRQIVCVVITAVLLFPAPAQCWWDEGHQVIARIAVKHLTPAALLRVSNLLDVENTPEAVAGAMATASIWADQVMADTETGSWHFLNLTLQDSRANIAGRCPDDDCATVRVRLFAAQLKANDPAADSRFSDEDALRFLVHIVGDLHQPLHASSDADQNGNCETLDVGIDQAKNLHAVWDGPLVSRMGVDDTALATELDAEIADMPDDERADFSTGDPDDWAWEAHRLAVVNVYKRLAIPKQEIVFPETCSQAPDEIQQLHVEIDEKYMHDMQPIVRQQLKKAGLRLARLLNETLGGS
jgi:hypothetical protein